jgi:hypothetical protein
MLVLTLLLIVQRVHKVAKVFDELLIEQLKETRIVLVLVHTFRLHVLLLIMLAMLAQLAHFAIAAEYAVDVKLAKHIVHVVDQAQVETLCERVVIMTSGKQFARATHTFSQIGQVEQTIETVQN